MKLLVFVILMNCTLLSALSVDDYFPRATPQQEEEYYTAKANNPLRTSYNPLQVGNKWYFSGWYFDGEQDQSIPYHLEREVIADSLIDGILHYQISGLAPYNARWMYNQGDSTIAYYMVDNGTHEFHHGLWYVFTPGVTFYPYWNYNNPITCPHFELRNVLGHVVNVIRFVDNPSYYFMWAEGFGPCYSSFDFGETYLMGAVLDGINYGIVPNVDDQFVNVGSLSISSYPNPFSNCVNLKLDSKFTASSDIFIYNLKGQLVCHWLDTKSSEVVWDGKDKLSKTVSPGIYFIKAVNGNRTCVGKLLKVR